MAELRKREVVKIDRLEKEYTIEELTLKQIIELTEGSIFFSDILNGEKVEKQEEGKEKKQRGMKDDLSDIMKDLDRLMDNCCDFTSKDLIDLSPSEIRKIYDTFKLVNSDFLSFVKALGVAEILLNLRDAALDRFSKLLAISLKLDM